MGRRLIGKSLLAIAFVGIALIGGNALGSSTHSVAAATGSTYKWATVETGMLITPYNEGPIKPMPIGTVVSFPKDDLTNNSGSSSASLWGRVGYAIAYINRYQYPLRTINDGRTWTVDGPYWTNGGASGGAGATFIDTFSPSQAVAYGNQWLYVTMDSGKHWYVVDGLRNIVSVEPSQVEWWRSAPWSPSQIIADVVATGSGKNAHNIVSSAQYISSHGGRVWTLLPASGS